MTVGSLFAGIGGIDIGFKQAGFHILWAIENDSACCKTYRYNHKGVHLIESDIRKIDARLLSKVDILVAGFLCQPFSIAGKQNGFNDPRGHLFYSIIKYINVLNPRFVFLENVPNLMYHDNGRTFLSIHSFLAELGYVMRYRVLRASEYGNVPQIRDRIYIIAFREQKDCDCFSYPNKIELNISIDKIIKSDEKNIIIITYLLVRIWTKQ